MISAAVILSIIDSILQLTLLQIKSLPEAQQQARAIQVQADIDWWRSLLHLPGVPAQPAIPPITQVVAPIVKTP